MTGKVIIGKNVVIGDNCQLEGQGGLEIGNDVLMASRIYIGTTSHGKYKGMDSVSPLIPPNKREVVYGKVYIGDNTWIGNGVAILYGVHIGKGCVIGANAVVTKDVPDFCIVAGVPARVIKKFDFEKEQWITEKSRE